jgi:carboxypeptidase A
VFSATAEKSRFDNYRVYRISVENELHLRVLQELSETSDSYNFLDEPRSIGSTVDVLVPPHKFSHFSEIVEKFQFETTLTNKNFQE